MYLYLIPLTLKETGDRNRAKNGEWCRGFGRTEGGAYFKNLKKLSGRNQLKNVSNLKSGQAY